MSDERHAVRDGDCVSNVAAEHGMLPETLWRHPDNRSLREQRKDPNVLEAGDTLVVPEKSLRTESGATEQRHQFRRLGGARLRLRLTEDDRPRANIPFVLEVADQTVEGNTDADGFLDAPVPPTAVEGLLRLQVDGREELVRLQIGFLDPLDSDKGVRDRLRGIGVDAEGNLADALRRFQGKVGLEPSGKLDDATRARLEEVFGQ